MAPQTGGGPGGACNSPGCTCPYGHPGRANARTPAAQRQAEQAMLDDHIRRTTAELAAWQTLPAPQQQAGLEAGS